MSVLRSAGICPTRDELVAFSRGDLPLESLEAIAEHLGSCATCEAALDETGSSDEMLVTLRHLSASGSDEAPDVQAEMAALEAGGPERRVAEITSRPEQLREYRLLETIGAGGMGTVYRALHTRLGRVVALKTLPAWRMNKPEAVTRFEREMKAVGQLSHPNIVQATDAGEVDGTHFLVMEFVEGLDLARLVKQVGPLPAAAACEIARQAAVALEYAHQHGLVHRDIKPSNLLLPRDGQVKLLDLGLARLCENPLENDCSTDSGTVLGSFDYMAPEQAEDPHAVDARADLYGLGCALYHLLTGEPPFSSREQRTAAAKLKAHALLPVPDLSSRRPDAPAGLAAIIKRLMAKDPAARYANAAEVAATLEPFCQGSNLQALLQPGTGTVETSPSWRPPVPARRRTSALAALIGLGAALLALTTIYIKTSTGVVEIVSDDRDVRVIVEQGGEHITVVDLATNRQVELRAGKYRLQLDGRNDLELLASDFELKRGETIIARIRRKAADPAVAKPAPLDAAELARRPAAADGLRRAQVPPALLAGAGGGNPDRAPSQLVAILGNRLLRGTLPATDFCYSPDGGRIAVAYSKWQDEQQSPGEVRVYDAATGREVLAIEGQSGGITSVCFHPDGSQLVSGRADGAIQLWDAATGQQLKSLAASHFKINSLAFSHDGRRLASGSGTLGASGELKVWDLASATEIRTLKGHDAAIRCVAYNADGTRLASGGGDKVVRVWDPESGDELHKLAGHGQWIHGVAFSPDGRRLATASYDYTVKLWNLETGQTELTLRHDWVASDVRFTIDGARLATACWDRKLRIWETASGQLVRAFDGHTDSIARLAFGPDEKQLASCGLDRSVRIWDTQTGRSLAPLGHDAAVTSLAVSPDGKLLASGSQDTSVRAWDLATGEELFILVDDFSWELPAAPVTGLAFHPAGQVLASAHNNGIVRLWDTMTGKPRRRIIAADKSAGGIHALAYGPDGLLATAGNDHLVKLWNAETGEHLRTLRGHGGPVRALAFSADGRTLAAGGDAGLIKLWEPEHGAELRTLTGPPVPVRSLDFLPDDRTLAAGADGLVKLWDTQTGTSRDLPTGLPGNIQVVAHPAGQLLATSSATGGVKLWNLSHDLPPAEILVAGGAGQGIQALAFTPEGRYLATANGDGTLYVLRLAPAAR